tara:strand:- start:2344 stop:3279 length:936 start_codon:yes stop_codon:yes gene_type:complete
MSKLITNTIRHTGGSADNITLDNSQNVTVEGNATVDGTSTLTGNVTASGNLGVGVSPSHLVHIKKDTTGGAVGTKVVIENAATDTVNNKAELYLKTARGDFGFVHYNATESYIQVPDQLIINTNNATSATQALHIDTSQNVKISNGDLFFGAAGKGICLGVTSNTDANTLDDYEVGTFTPKLGGNANNSTYNVSGSGHYVKVGHIVHVSVRFHGVDLDQNADGTVIITDMPFTGTSASTNPVCAAGTTTNFETYNIVFDNSKRPSFYLSNNTTWWQGLQSVSNGSWTNWDIDDFNVQNVLYMDLSGTYRTT